MTTHDTTELSLRTAICPFRMPTGIAPLARIGGINGDHHHPGPPRFVGDECPQLAESPIAVPCSLSRPANPCPLADVGQCFNPNRSLRAFGLGNETLTNDMVRVLLEPALSPAQLLQSTFGRLRTNRLQRLAPIGVPLAFLLNLAARMSFPTAVYRQVNNPHIHTKHRVNILGIGFLNLARYQQIPVVTVEQQRARRSCSW
jgi:hypothetical protein